MGDGDRIFRSVECIGERNINIVPEIRTGPSPGPPGSRGVRVEYIAEPEIPEQVVVTGGLVTGRVTRFEFNMANLVVLVFFLGVSEDLVRFIDFLELFFCVLTAFVEVRMVFPCKVPERFLEIVRCSIPFYAKYLDNNPVSPCSCEKFVLIVILDFEISVDHVLTVGTGGGAGRSCTRRFFLGSSCLLLCLLAYMLVCGSPGFSQDFLEFFRL